MVLHDHAGGDEPHHQPTIDRNARLGRNLFFVYLAFYLGYVLLTSTSPDTMRATAIGGVNVAITYGFALILLALVLALVYSWLCRNQAAEEQTK